MAGSSICAASVRAAVMMCLFEAIAKCVVHCAVV